MLKNKGYFTERIYCILLTHSSSSTFIFVIKNIKKDLLRLTIVLACATLMVRYENIEN